MKLIQFSYIFFLTVSFSIFSMEDSSLKNESIMLCNAAKMNDLQAICEILESLTNGESINTADENGWQPIHYAAYNNNFELVKLLVNKGANSFAIITQGEFKGKQPLELTDDIEIKKLFIDAFSELGMSAENILEEATTCKEITSINETNNILKIFFKSLAKIFRKRSTDQFCVNQLCRILNGCAFGQITLSTLLIGGVPLNAFLGQMIINPNLVLFVTFISILFGYLRENEKIRENIGEEFRLLLRGWLNNYTPMDYKKFKLCVSGIRREVYCGDLYRKITEGANIDTQDQLGCTALIRAAIGEEHERVISFIENGANINIQDNDGCTALIWTALFGNVNTAKILLERNADINTRDHEGCTALLRAVQENYKEITELLLSYHADVNIADNLGYNALTHALGTANEEIIALLLDYDENLIK